MEYEKGICEKEINQKEINEQGVIIENMLDEEVGVLVPKILFPRQDISLEEWSVVACDQYTSQIDYWERVKERVGDSPSTLKMIYPEVYLEESNGNSRIDSINNTMKSYIENGVLCELEPGFIYVERETLLGYVRRGLMLAVDLEKYDYNLGSQTLIRATEGTVLDRLPPRIKIREKASLEIPHIMLLIDDPDKTVIEPISTIVENLNKIYDFELMEKGGRLKGYKLDNIESIQSIFDSLQKLADKDDFKNKYSVDDTKGVLLFAVGDGNHSLATAKACWEEAKKTLSEEAKENHPARYALVEVVNIHDDALIFEPIHRVVFNVDKDKIEEQMLEYFKSKNIDAFCKRVSNKEALEAEVIKLRQLGKSHVIPYTLNGNFGVLVLNNTLSNLEVGSLQAFLDGYIKINKIAKIDYIHGEQVVDELGAKDGNIGFYLPPMDKQDLFKTVILDGALPRKTFSMGEAEEKRYYLECKKIK